ncbi:PAS domain S-box protein [Azospirillum sp.]|uniref:PAS domain-containing hybrid sensor histidine kinase/response regulator n=1 Tax=Azospirillum sp. TaxID=34012 RepID=UPI002D64A08F|nr:PAS domain S-box protein [Azospirillum sp.]HYD69022.1 PAS domain S-box protein [Azospirillum sp.]
MDATSIEDPVVSPAAPGDAAEVRARVRWIVLPGLLLVLLGACAMAALLAVTADRHDDATILRIVAGLSVVIAAMAALGFVTLRRAVRTAELVERTAGMLRAANRDLADSRQRFRDFAESSSDWFWESAADHRFTYVSERLCTITGGDPRAVFGETLTGLGAFVEDADTWREYEADIAAGRAFRDLEIMWQDGTGKTHVFRLAGQPVRDGDGRFAGYRGTGVDVTTETMALVEARFMQVVVHDALDSISEGFVLFSADGRLLFCNGQYRHAYPNIADVLVPGTPFEEILRVAAERGGYPDAQGDIGTWIQDRLKRHLEHEAPVDRQLSDGRWYRISEHATGSGGIVKILMDITELKRREQELAQQTDQLATTVNALRESEKRYRQLVELAPYGIAIWDRTAIRFANTAAASILGTGGSGSLEGAPLASLFTGVDGLEARLGRAVEGPGERVACEAVRPNGERRHVEVGAYPAVYQREPAVLLVIADVTDRRRAEEELQRAQKMEAVGRMAGGIAHEFNNMLTAIGGFARLAERSPADEARVLTCVREIAKASDRAAALTGQLLDFSRRRSTEEMEVMALAGLVRDLRIFLKPLMSAGVDLDLDIRDASAHAVANAVTLNQALLNLAINARDAMPDGGRITVTLDVITPDGAFFNRHEGLRPGRYAVLRVADTGCGVPEAIRDRIWEPFFTTKEPGKGTGLGLWMVYGTAQQAGGAVEMASEPGKGSVFSLYLPAVDPPDEEDGGIEPVRLPEGEAAAVLLVDDEESVRSYLKLALEEAGCHVTEAGDGVAALERWDECGGLFDLVVTDVSMPRMNGAELARELEGRNPNLRMLFLTGYTSRDKAEGLTAKAGRALLMKPIGPERLIQAVRDLLAD